MSWLLDTNVLSELRKGERANVGVRSWFAQAADVEVFTSVLVLGEIRRGIESIRRRDVTGALALKQWLLIAVFLLKRQRAEPAMTLHSRLQHRQSGL